MASCNVSVLGHNDLVLGRCFANCKGTYIYMCVDHWLFTSLKERFDKEGRLTLDRQGGCTQQKLAKPALSIRNLFCFSICNWYCFPHFLVDCHQGLQQQYNVQTLLTYMALGAQEWSQVLIKFHLGYHRTLIPNFSDCGFEYQWLVTHPLKSHILFSLYYSNRRTITLCYPK